MKYPPSVAARRILPRLRVERHGLQNFPRGGRQLVELILDCGPRTVDITPFRFERFAEWNTGMGTSGNRDFTAKT